MSVTAVSSALEAARCYLAAGLTPIPIQARTKKPALRSWKRYQAEQPSQRDIDNWFENAERGVGIVCGRVSGCLVVLDWDALDDYQQWAADHPDLSAIAPTVATPRPGCHVFLRTREPIRSCKPAAGLDVKAEGGYVIAPPSIHPSGERYRMVSGSWDSIPVVDENEVVPPPTASERSERAERTEKSEIASESLTSLLSLCSLTSLRGEQPLVELAIRSTQPTVERQRNRLLFVLAVKLRGIFGDVDPRTLKPIVAEWHRLALPRITTKPFDESWADFLYAWPRVKFPGGLALDDALLTATAAGKHPACESLGYEAPDRVLLVAICAELQRLNGRNPFHLSSHVAARLLGVDQYRSYRLLCGLVGDGVLEVIKVGNQRRATRYRFAWTGEGLS